MPKTQIKKEIFQKYINSLVFKIMMIVIFMIILYGITNYCLNKSYSDSLLTLTSVPLFLICFFILPQLITVINVYMIFNQNYFLLIRFQTKKIELKELLKCILYSCSYMFAISLIILLIGLNFVCASDLGFTNNYKFYNIPNIVYIIFYITRIYAWMMILSLSNGIFLYRLPSKVVIALNIVLCGLLLSYAYSPLSTGRTSILDTSPLIFEYLQQNSFSNFFTEILCSIFALLLPLLMLKIIFNLYFKNINLNIIKYITLNDFSYTICTKKVLIMVYISYLIIFSILKVTIMKYTDIGFNVVLGLAASREYSFINTLSLFINILVYVIIGITLFTKDLLYNKENIFLRIDKDKWSIIKIFSITLQTCILLLCSYLVTFTIFSIFGYIPTNIVTLFFTNLIVLILLELITFVLTYGNNIIKILIATGISLLLCFDNICISNITKYLVYLLTFTLVVIILIVWFLKKNIYKLFEREVLK